MEPSIDPPTTTTMDLPIVERISKTLIEQFKEFHAQLEKLQTQMDKMQTQVEKMQTLPPQVEKLQTQMEKMQTFPAQVEKLQTQMEKMQKSVTNLDKGMQNMEDDLNMTILDAIHGQKKCPSETDVHEIGSKLNSSPGR